MSRLLLLASACLLLLAISNSHAQPIPFDSDRWEINAESHHLETYNGKQSLYMKGGGALLQDVAFQDGEIAFEIAFAQERGFAGVAWRWQETGNYEDFYFRPHQSGNPDANQYTPVFNGISGWQLYYGEAYSVPVTYPFNTWIPVKIVVAGAQAEVYIQDMEEPALFISELKRPIAAGGVGLTASAFAPARFANFRVIPMNDPPPLKGTPQPPMAAPEGSIMAWSVSNALDEKRLENVTRLTGTTKAGLTWTTLAAEATGIANLARVQGLTDEANTAFARVTVTSDREQVKPITFGFSDRVRVYFNDRLLYRGADGYTSRDYRFLGTVGYFDTLYLPLREGENELWFAISENFGGWGLQARFEDMEGITVRE